MYQYILDPRAQSEYEKSVEWYTERSERATINFIANTDNTINLICKQPYQSKNVYKNFHEASIKKYPFTIIYTIEEKIKTVVIFSIYHHKRSPKKKYKSIRIKK